MKLSILKLFIKIIYIENAPPIYTVFLARLKLLSRYQQRIDPPSPDFLSPLFSRNTRHATRGFPRFSFLKTTRTITKPSSPFARHPVSSVVLPVATDLRRNAYGHLLSLASKGRGLSGVSRDPMKKFSLLRLSARAAAAERATKGEEEKKTRAER